VRFFLLTALPLGLALALAIVLRTPTAALAGGVVTDCTEAGFAERLAGGGAVTFNCGSGSHVITLSSAKIITADTTIDGGAVISISGGNATRIFSVTAGASLELVNLTIRDSNVYTFLFGTFGGAVYNNGVLRVNHSTFISNTAGEGGAIANYGTLVVDSSTFISNAAPYGVGFGGGAINSVGLLTVTQSAFSGNTGNSGGALTIIYSSASVEDSTLSGNTANGGGGGIENFGGSLSLNRTSIVRNRSLSYGLGGGGIDTVGGSLTINNSTILSNTANGSGGGILSFGSGIVLINNSVVKGNTTQADGAGMYNLSNSRLYLTASTIAANSAGGNGGGMANDNVLSMTNSTVSGNSAAGSGGGITNTGALTVVNSTFADNTAGVSGGSLHQTSGAALFVNTLVAYSSPNNCAGALTSLGHNLDSANDCNFLEPTDLRNTDPRLGPLQDNGGPTLTRALAPASPAIDAGDNATCPNTDQRGASRPVDGNRDGLALCDIGAFEGEYRFLFLPAILR
jgi:hypothetical protein